MEAQPYPADFNDIAAGAPANNVVVLNTYHHAWNNYANIDPVNPMHPFLLFAALLLAGCTDRPAATDPEAVAE